MCVWVHPFIHIAETRLLSNLILEKAIEGMLPE